MVDQGKIYACAIVFFWVFLFSMALYRSASSKVNRRVVVFARHGDRTPGSIPPSLETYWLAKLSLEKRSMVASGAQALRSQLTQEGETQMVRLGEALLAALPWVKDLQPEQRGFYSTDYDRTKESALLVQSVVEGISYNRSETHRIHFSDRQHDALDPWESLPGYSDRVLSFYASDAEYTSEVARVEPLKRDLMENSMFEYFQGDPSRFYWIDAFDIMFCTRAHVSDAPNASKILARAEEIQQTTEKQYGLLYAEQELRRMASGGIFAGLADWTLRRTSSGSSVFHINPTDAFSFVACHDVNILPMKFALGWPESSSWPGYTDFLAFEASNDGIVVSDQAGRMRSFSTNMFAEKCLKEAIQA
jgi:hypothetical protein